MPKRISAIKRTSRSHKTAKRLAVKRDMLAARKAKKSSKGGKKK